MSTEAREKPDPMGPGLRSQPEDGTGEPRAPSEAPKPRPTLSKGSIGLGARTGLTAPPQPMGAVASPRDRLKKNEVMVEPTPIVAVGQAPVAAETVRRDLAEESDADMQEPTKERRATPLGPVVSDEPLQASSTVVDAEVAGTIPAFDTHAPPAAPPEVVIPPSPPSLESSEPAYPIPQPVEAPAGDPFKQFEDEGDDVTQIDASSALAEQTTYILEEEAPPPFLECAAGKDEGKEYVLHVGETTLGRSIDNDIILTDIAVSRRHLKINRHEDGTIRLHDLGSGNGTLLNAKRAFESVLQAGDRIELGETVLVLRTPPPRPAKPRPAEIEARASDVHTDDSAIPTVDSAENVAHTPAAGTAPGASQLPPPAPVTGPVQLSRGVLVALTVLGSVIVVSLAATVTVVVLHSRSTPTQTISQVPTAQESLAEAQQAYRERRWEDSSAAYQRVLVAESGNVEALTRLQILSRVRADERLLTEARAALATGNARDALQKARQIDPRGPLQTDATTLANSARDILVSTAVHEGEIAIQQDRLEDARAKLEEARGLDPNSVLAVRLGTTLAAAEAAEDAELADASVDAEVAVVDAGVAPAVPDAAVVAVAPVPTANPPTNGATGTAQNTQAPPSREPRPHEPRPREPRPREPRPSPARHENEATVLIIEARAAIDAGQGRTGCPKVTQALAIDRNNAQGRILLRRCEEIAERMYQRGSGLERTNRTEAISVYRQIMSMLPGGDVRRRAQSRVVFLSSARDEDQ